MIVVLLMGAGFGVGLLTVWSGARPRAVPLAVAIRRAAAVPTSEMRPVAGRRGRRSAALTKPVESRMSSQVASDLEVSGRTVERHALDKLATAVALGALPLAMLALSNAVGSTVPSGLTLLAAIGGLAGGYLLPDWLLHSHAQSRRRQFRFALSSYLDLVNVLLAGGAGVETALEASADAGDGWAFHRIGAALLRARTTRRSPWAALGGLGDELGIDELVELAASVQLAGEEGARIRSSLAAKAAALRARQMAQIEADANAASERMGFPTVAMFVAFLALLAYPAVQQIAGA